MLVVELVLNAPVVAPQHQHDFWLRVLLQLLLPIFLS
jgi:hypothetical protein